MKKLICILSILFIFLTDVFLFAEDKPEIKVVQGHFSETIRQLYFSKDGKQFFSQSDDGVRIWDTATGKLLKSYVSIYSENQKGQNDFYFLEKTYDGNIMPIYGKWSTNSYFQSTDESQYDKYKYGINWFSDSTVDFKSALFNNHPLTDKFIEILKKNPFNRRSDGNKNFIVSELGKTNITLYSTNNNSIMPLLIKNVNGHRSMAISSDGKYAAVISNDSFSKLTIYDDKGKVFFEQSLPYRCYCEYIVFSNGSNSLYLGGEIENQYIGIIIFDTQKKIFSEFMPIYEKTDRSQRLNCMAISSDEKLVLTGDSHSVIKIWDIKNRFSHFSIDRSSGNFATAYSNDKKRFFIVIGDFLSKFGQFLIFDIMSGRKLWNLKTPVGESKDTLFTKYSYDEKYVFYGLKKDFHLLNIKDNKDFSDIFKQKGISDKNSYIFAPSFYNKSNKILFLEKSYDLKEKLIYSKIKVYDVEKNSIIKEIFFSNMYQIGNVFITPDDKYLIIEWFNKTSYNGDEGSFIYDAENFKKIVFLDGVFIFNPPMISGNKIIIPSYEEIYLYDIKSKELKRSDFMDPVSNKSITQDGKILAIFEKSGKITYYNPYTFDKINTFNYQNNEMFKNISNIEFFPDNKHIIATGGDKTIRIMNIETEKWTSFLINEEGSQWIIYNSDGYWDSSANGGDLVAMVRGLECWNIDQFAVKNNRPDLIYAKLPFKDDGLIEHYKNQYLKRLKKLGFVDANGNPDESLLSQDYHVPEAKIVESKINGKFVDLKIELSDSLYPLKRYNVFVNDVPLFGAYGKDIASTSLSDLSITEKIELTAGANKIEVSCMNEKGAESYRALTMASYNPSTPVRPDLYFIGFGVSKYIDPDIRQLGFADKDAKDLEIVYSNMKSQYANIYTKTYINEECTVENIKKAKEFLKSAKPDDTFVLFIAGHGIHDTDKEATYYFVTHETKLDNLSQTAANFDIIEDIMQGIPPRNKLFLMDTCESGEIDDDIQAEYFTMADNRGIKSRAIETERALKKKDDSTKKTTKRTYLFEKDRYIYNDLVRRSGAIVFSSCKGGELSYESEAVGNGFFTNKIIESLKGRTADIDKNGIISIDELKNFVIAEVPKLADGKQNPTVDRDNIYQKFGFVGVK